MKALMVLIFTIAVAVSGTAGYFLGVGQSVTPPSNQAAPHELKLTENVQAVVDAKMKLLASLASSPVVIQGIKKSNNENRDLTQALINQRDQAWRQSKGVDNSIKPYLTNAVAKELMKFQRDNLGFTEIFVTDVKGLNVGLTNKTSDYYQSDEAWWQQSYNAGKGKAFNGKIEFDESAQSEAIALYHPIIDPQTQQAIGVLKTLLDINVIKSEL